MFPFHSISEICRHVTDIRRCAIITELTRDEAITDCISSSVRPSVCYQQTNKNTLTIKSSTIHAPLMFHSWQKWQWNSLLTGIVWLPCNALMAVTASAWLLNLTKAQPENSIQHSHFTESTWKCSTQTGRFVIGVYKRSLFFHIWFIRTFRDTNVFKFC